MQTVLYQHLCVATWCQTYSYFCPDSCCTLWGQTDASWSFNVAASTYEWIRWFWIGIICHISQISIGELMHILQVMTFLPGRNLTKTSPFATRYLKISRSGPFTFLTFCPFVGASDANFLLFSGFPGIAPSTYFNFTRNTFINNSTGDLQSKQFNVTETLKIQEVARTHCITGPVIAEKSTYLKN